MEAYTLRADIKTRPVLGMRSTNSMLNARRVVRQRPASRDAPVRRCGLLHRQQMGAGTRFQVTVRVRPVRGSCRATSARPASAHTRRCPARAPAPEKIPSAELRRRARAPARYAAWERRRPKKEIFALINAVQRHYISLPILHDICLARVRCFSFTALGYISWMSGWRDLDRSWPLR